MMMHCYNKNLPFLFLLFFTNFITLFSKNSSHSRDTDVVNTSIIAYSTHTRPFAIDYLLLFDVETIDTIYYLVL